MQSADLWLVLEGCLVSLEESGEGRHMGWWLLMALLVDHSTRAHGDTSKKIAFLVRFLLPMVELAGGI